MKRLFLGVLVTAFVGPMAAAQTTAGNQAEAPAAVSAPAGTTTSAPTKTAANPADRMVCEREQVPGSRLQSHRVCKTASEWEEERRQAQQDVTHAQTNRGW